MLKIKQWGKRVLALSLVVAMFVTTGCGSKKDEGVSTDDTTPAATKAADNGTDATASDEMITITLYRDSFNVAQPDANEVKAVQDAINAYIGDKINVQIDFHDIGSGEYAEKTNLALTAGEIDLFLTFNWINTISCDDLVKQNAVYDLTDLLPGTDLYNALPTWVWDESSFNGKNYFVSGYKEAAEGYDIMYRADLADKYGWDITSVKTLKDLEPMLADCLAEGLKYPYLSQKTAMFYRYYMDKYDFFAGKNYIGVDRATNEVVNTIQTPDFKEFCSLMGDWAQKGYLSEDDLTKTTTDTTTHTKDWGISWWTDVPNNAEANGRYTQDVKMSTFTQNYRSSYNTLGACYAVSSSASEEEAKACIKFLGLLYTDKTLCDLYAYGIEGTDYTVENGKYKKTDAGLYNHGMWETAPFTIVSLEVGEPDNKAELYTKYNESAQKSIALGFRFDRTPVDAEYTSCVSVFDEFGFPLENGAFAPADVDGAIADYQKALDDAGYQKVLAEAQKQYNAWKASK